MHDAPTHKANGPVVDITDDTSEAASPRTPAPKGTAPTLETPAPVDPTDAASIESAEEGGSFLQNILPGQHKRLKFKTPPGQAAHRPAKIDSDNAESPAGETSDDAPLDTKPAGPSTSETPVATESSSSPIGSRKRKTKKGHK